MGGSAGFIQFIDCEKFNVTTPLVDVVVEALSFASQLPLQSISIQPFTVADIPVVFTTLTSILGVEYKGKVSSAAATPSSSS